jgi:threonine/homoserine/homoserine lactone efflux protein
VLESTFTFIAITVALEVTPGPAVLFILYQSAFGLRYALAGVAGLMTANVIWISLVATGLGLMLVTTPWLFDSVRYVGALYLAYLGYRIARYGIGKPHAEKGTQKKSKLRTYQQGIMTSLSNPKAVLFFLALLPQFARPEYFMSDLMYFGGLKILILFVLMTSFGFLGRSFFNRIMDSDKARWVFRILGVGIIVAAYGVAFSEV